MFPPTKASLGMLIIDNRDSKASVLQTGLIFLCWLSLRFRPLPSRLFPSLRLESYPKNGQTKTQKAGGNT